MGVSRFTFAEPQALLMAMAGHALADPSSFQRVHRDERSGSVVPF